MTGRAAARLGVAIVGAASALALAGLAIRLQAPETLRGHVSGDAIAIASLAATVLVGTLGWLLVRRATGNVIGWVFLGTSLVLALGGTAEVYAYWATHGRQQPLPGAAFARLVYEGGGGLFWSPLFAILLLFPDGRPPPGRWRWLVPLTVVVLSAQVVVGVTRLDLDALWFAQTLLLLPCSGAVIARYRRARGVERQQLRWIAVSGGLILLGAAVLAVTGSVTDGAGTGPGSLIGPGLLVLGFASLPVAATVAITRYRLYDLDRLVTRATAYGGAVAMTATLYGVSVLLVRAVLPVARGSDLTVAASTLVAAAVFSPLQRRLRDVIDRRFHRRRYDAVRALDELGTRLRDEVDERMLLADVARVLGTTLGPAHVSVWRP